LVVCGRPNNELPSWPGRLKALSAIDGVWVEAAEGMCASVEGTEGTVGISAKDSLLFLTEDSSPTEVFRAFFAFGFLLLRMIAAASLFSTSKLRYIQWK
jgi:hypothetical protein